MTAEIVDFASRESVLDTDFGFINGKAVNKPKNSEDYRLLVKRFLATDDYEEFCLCCMDDEYYETAEPQIKNIVDCYYEF